MPGRVTAFAVCISCFVATACAGSSSLLFGVSASARCLDTQSAPGFVASKRGPKRLVVDYGYWSKSQRPSYSADQIPYHRVTHIIHAGIALAEARDGDLEVPDGYLEPALNARAHTAGVKVMVLVGGGADIFRDVAAKPAARRRFAARLRAFVDAHGYDGVDVDWEYPRGPADGAAFVAMMADLRAALPAPDYLVSIDVPSDPGQVGGAYDFRGLLPSLDFVNDMTYDMAGPWTDRAQLNSPLYPDPANPQPNGSVAQSLDLFTGRYGIPATMINVGTPFYGYRYTTTHDLYDRCGCHGQAVYVNYGTYVKQRVDAMGWHRRVDARSGNPYLLFGSTLQPGFITYDDPLSTYRRASYALWTRGAGGVFAWSLDEDYDGRSQDLFDAMYGAWAHPDLDVRP